MQAHEVAAYVADVASQLAALAAAARLEGVDYLLTLAAREAQDRQRRT